MTATLLRPPAGEWVHLACRTYLADDGFGLARADLFDGAVWYLTPARGSTATDPPTVRSSDAQHVAKPSSASTRARSCAIRAPSATLKTPAAVSASRRRLRSALRSACSDNAGQRRGSTSG